jgi:hypothetical protein
VSSTAQPSASDAATPAATSLTPEEQRVLDIALNPEQVLEQDQAPLIAPPQAEPPEPPVTQSSQVAVVEPATKQVAPPGPAELPDSAEDGYVQQDDTDVNDPEFSPLPNPFELVGSILGDLFGILSGKDIRIENEDELYNADEILDDKDDTLNNQAPLPETGAESPSNTDTVSSVTPDNVANTDLNALATTTDNTGQAVTPSADQSAIPGTPAATKTGNAVQIKTWSSGGRITVNIPENRE